ncbi:MAG: hypothetical protein HEEMFOPI_00944 [Holosporales bacterium]
MAEDAIGGVSSNQLRLIIEKIERLEEEKTQISEHIKDAFAEAKGEGFDIKTLRSVLKLRKMKPEDMSEQEELLDLYLSALGMRARSISE